MITNRDCNGIDWCRRRLMACWYGRGYARNCWCGGYQTSGNRHWEGAGKRVIWQLHNRGIKNYIRLQLWVNRVGFASTGPACFHWLALVSGSRPSGLLLDIYTIQKRENIIGSNLDFYPLNFVYKSVQHNLSAMEKTSSEMNQSKSTQSEEFGAHRY